MPDASAIPEEFPVTLSTLEVSERLGCSVKTVKGWCKELGMRRVGRTYRLTERDISELRKYVRPGPGRPRGKVKK